MKSAKQLKRDYFAAAKKYHPDSREAKASGLSKAELEHKFNEVTLAYEKALEARVRRKRVPPHRKPSTLERQNLLLKKLAIG
jgi:DnaJ-class molecular chaperone